MNEEEADEFRSMGYFLNEEHDDPWEKAETDYTAEEGRYLDKELIGSGGVKNVFKVFDSKMHRHVALAELKENVPDDQCEMFLAEASTTSSLRHPNIINVYDQGTNEALVPFFTMELKVGRTLVDVIKEEKKSLHELLEIFLKICDAIAYAHSQNIIHLDLKPDNIQVGEFGEVQVCDWGLAQKDGQKTVQETISGTPGYMSPEQVTKGAKLTYKSDIFALGAILYSIVSKEKPMEGGLRTIIGKTLTGEIESISERFPEKNIPRSIDAVVSRAMSAEPSERYSSVEELKAEVSQFMSGYSTDAENAGVLKEFHLFLNRNRQVSITVAVALLIIISGTVLYLIELKKSKAETESAYQKLAVTHVKLKESNDQEKLLAKQKEEAQEKLLEESEQKKKMYAQLLDKELKQAFDLLTYPLFFESPKESAEKAVEILKNQFDPNQEQKALRRMLVHALFISQRYSEVKTYADHRYVTMVKIAESFKDRERQDNGLLMEKDFITVLRILNSKGTPLSRQRIIERAICYFDDVNKNSFTSLKIVKELFRAWNPSWSTENFNYNGDDLYLQLRGKDLKILLNNNGYSSNKSFLRFLKIDTLDIRETGIDNLSHIYGANIQKLDIRNTPITSLEPFEATKNILEVYVSKGQLGKDKRIAKPKSVKVISD